MMHVGQRFARALVSLSHASLMPSTRSVTCALSVLSAAAAIRPQAVSAQDASRGQPVAGAVYNPIMSPANPDIVAYETLNGDRQELFLYRVSTGRRFPATRAAQSMSAGVVGIPGLSGGAQRSVYSGEADFRPVLVDGRQWFAYIASERGTFKLLVNYLDDKGALSPREPITLPFGGGARQPRWSADGRHLAFVSDSGILHIYPNLGNALRSGNTAALQASRVVQAGIGVRFPAWSPKGNYLAYEIERTIRGSRRSQIEVIAFDTVSVTARGTPVLLTEDLTDASAFRPSWSPDARHVAYYVDRLSARGDASNSSVDIGIVAAQVQPTSGRILRGEILTGSSRRIAEGVRPNLWRGPGWTRMFVGTDVRDALVYVQADDAKADPIYVHSVDAWLALRPRDESRVSMTDLFKSENAKEVSVTESRGFVRYTYSTLGGGGQEVRTYDDMKATWAKGAVAVAEVLVVAEKKRDVPPPPVVVTDPERTLSAARRSSLPLSVVFPGMGQLAGGHKLKGTLFSLVGLAGASAFALGYTGGSSAIDAGFAAKDRAAFDKAESDFNGKRTMQMAGVGALGTAWLIGLIDAARSGGPTKNVGLITAPGPRSAVNANGSLGLRVPLGRRAP